ncbi:hypothetical protein PI125_g20669 [Phytophthora idaei]|nr:hypothetical protein PI125_g20669 [Phytophthora idaei]
MAVKQTTAPPHHRRTSRVAARLVVGGQGANSHLLYEASDAVLSAGEHNVVVDALSLAPAAATTLAAVGRRRRSKKRATELSTTVVVGSNTARTTDGDAVSTSDVTEQKAPVPASALSNSSRSAEEEREPNEDATVTVNDEVQTGGDGIGSKQSMSRTGGVERSRDLSMNDGDRSACSTETDDVAVTGATVTNRGTPGNMEPGVTATKRHERDPKVTVSDRSTRGKDEETRGSRCQKGCPGWTSRTADTMKNRRQL